MATIVTPTTITASVNSLNGTQKTDLQTALGIGGTAPGGGGEVFLTEITDGNGRQVTASMLGGGGNALITPLTWPSGNTVSFGSFDGTRFTFNKSVTATVGLIIGGYAGFHTSAVIDGSFVFRFVVNERAMFGASVTKSTGIISCENSTSVTQQFTSGQSIYCHLATSGLNSALFAGGTYGTTPVGGSSSMYIAVM